MIYTFRQINSGTYQVAKWADGKQPESVYTVSKARSFQCDCPAHVRWCKHIELISSLIEAECAHELWLWHYDENGWQTSIDFERDYTDDFYRYLDVQ